MGVSLPVRSALLYLAVAGLSVLLYGLILSGNPDRYSLFKVILAIPAADGELRSPGEPSGTTSALPHLSRRDIPDLARLNDQFAAVFDRVMPAVVSIDVGELSADPSVRLKSYRKGQIKLPNGEVREIMVPVEWEWDENRQSDITHEIPGVGSGVIIDEEGYIVTNHHVVLDADNIAITTHKGERFTAELIGADSTVDMAVLRIKDAKGRKFPVLRFGDSERIRPGELVFAFGNPFGLSESITQGIVNGMRRRFIDDLANEYIQTDAVINPGNSGGPLTNVFGEFVGMNAIVYAGQHEKPQGWQGISLALPSNRVLRCYEELMELGQRVRPYLGVLFNDVSDQTRAAVSFSGKGGAYILNLEADSPAGTLLHSGDIVLRIARKEIKSASAATKVIQQQAPGVPLEFVVWRDKREQSVVVELGQFRDVNQIALLPAVFSSKLGPEELKSKLGLVLRELTPGDRKETGMPADLGGIFLWGVAPDSPLAGHLERHDMVHEINGKPVWTEKDFYELMGELPSSESPSLVLTRNRRRYYLQFRPPPGRTATSFIQNKPPASNV
jgi:S1-C subfamily serine protease